MRISIDIRIIFQEGWHTTSESVFFWMRHFVLSFYAYVDPKTSNYGTWLISFDWNYQGLLNTISKKAPSTSAPSGFLDQATWAKSLQSAIRPSETANGCGCQADPPENLIEVQSWVNNIIISKY
jgi:hypothetical protein